MTGTVLFWTQYRRWVARNLLETNRARPRHTFDVTGPWVAISSRWLATVATAPRTLYTDQSLAFPGLTDESHSGLPRNGQRISALATSGDGKLKPWRTRKRNRVCMCLECVTCVWCGLHNNIRLRFPFGICPCVACMRVSASAWLFLPWRNKIRRWPVMVYDNCECTVRWMRWFPQYSQGEGQNHHLAEGPSNTQLSRSSPAHCDLPGW